MTKRMRKLRISDDAFDVWAASGGTIGIFGRFNEGEAEARHHRRAEERTPAPPYSPGFKKFMKRKVGTAA